MASPKGNKSVSDDNPNDSGQRGEKRPPPSNEASAEQPADPGVSDWAKRQRLDVESCLADLRKLFADDGPEGDPNRKELTEVEEQLVADFVANIEAVQRKRVLSSQANTPCSSRQADLRDAQLNELMSDEDQRPIKEQEREVAQALIRRFPHKDFESIEAFLDLRRPRATDRVDPVVRKWALDMSNKTNIDIPELKLPAVEFLIALKTTMKLSKNDAHLLGTAVVAFNDSNVNRILDHADLVYNTARRLHLNLLAIGTELQNEADRRLGLELEMGSSGQPVIALTAAPDPETDAKLAQLLELVTNIQSKLMATNTTPEVPSLSNESDSGVDETIAESNPSQEENDGDTIHEEESEDNNAEDGIVANINTPPKLVVIYHKILYTTSWALLNDTGRAERISTYETARADIMTMLKNWPRNSKKWKPNDYAHKIRFHYARYYFFLYSIPNAIEDQKGNLVVKLKNSQTKVIAGPIPGMCQKAAFDKYFGEECRPQMTEIRRDVRDDILRLLRASKNVNNPESLIRQLDPMMPRREDFWNMYSLEDVSAGLHGEKRAFFLGED